MKKNSFTLFCFILAAALILTFFLSFGVGSYPMSPGTVCRVLWQGITGKGDVPPVFMQVVWQVRIPRIIMAILVGGALSVSGTGYQLLFQNPMVSPDILGVSAGAGFGAAAAMLAGGGLWLIRSVSFLFGIGAVLLTTLIVRLVRQRGAVIYILAGLVVSTFFQAMIAVLKTLADTDDVLPSITFWLMGSLGKANPAAAGHMLLLSVFCLIPPFLIRYHINVLALGEETARTTGVPMKRLRGIIITSSTLLTVGAVSLCGIIGWIGLIVPHIARFFVGAKFEHLLPASFLAGGLLLLIIDNLIRMKDGIALPVGVLTALVGSPLFVLIMLRERRALA
ncbi:MAG: iron ABC transporter permease [Eubacteriales bacterium]|nr:iron ABC transporter permease [Eubacteriales bacterium]